jgi:undecaprenol kinase
MKNKPFHKRLGYAITGIFEGWRQERSFRTHVWLGAVTIGALCVLHPAPVWWAIVTLSIGLVLAMELMNGAIEALIDHLHPEIHPKIRVVKDMAAGAVLITALSALAVAVILMADRF